MLPNHRAFHPTKVLCNQLRWLCNGREQRRYAPTVEADKAYPPHLGSILVRVENRQEFLDLDDPAVPHSAYTLPPLFANVSDLVLVIKTHRNRRSGVRPHPLCKHSLILHRQSAISVRSETHQVLRAPPAPTNLQLVQGVSINYWEGD